MRQRAKLTSWGLAVPVLVLAVGAQAEIWSRPLPGSNPCWSPARWRPRCRCSARVGARWRLAGWPSPQSRCWRSRRPRRPTTRPPTFAGLAAAFLVARYGSRRHALAGLAAALATLLLVARDQPGLAAAVATFVITAVLVGVTWGTGFTLRERHRHADEAKRRAVRAEADRDTATRLAVAEERARIARELHDIVAHAVSVMVLQSGAIRHNLPDTLTDDKDALYAVEGVGREALTEMRRLLKAMRGRRGR